MIRTMLARAAFVLTLILTCALIWSIPSDADAAPIYGTQPLPFCMNPNLGWSGCNGFVLVDPLTGNPISPGQITDAGSTALEGTVTSAAATPTSGAATFTSGTAYIGPLTPMLGRDIRVVLKGTWAGTVQIGTASAANGCTAGNINPLTVAGQAWGQYTANANEVVDTPTLGASGSNAAPVYCATATISSGTLTYAVRQ